MVAALALLVASCGGGGSGNESTANITLNGSVGDGPIVSATVTIRDAEGNLITSITSNNQANYRADLPADSKYPLLISASGGTDSVTGEAPGFTLFSAVPGSGETTANINPFTTLIVKTAQAMSGGLTTGNLSAAKTIVLDQAGFGLDARLTADPLSTPVTTDNVANIVKASETLAEMIRRTRSTLQTAGLNMTEDQLIEKLGADLTDGLLDGLGAAGAEVRIAATSNIVAGQVLTEALNNNLKVNGIPATALLDSAIQLTIPAASQTTADVPITAAMLSQTKQMINAAQALSANGELSTLASTLETIGADSLPVAISLPNNPTAGIDQAITALAAASDTELNTVIDAITVNNGNNPPVISGSPPTTVLVGSTYNFTPTVSDAEGDTLTFGISNKPSWATFNTSTGALTGSPSAGDVGSTGGIVISVSDGITVRALSPFSITVNDTSGNPLNITNTSLAAYQWDTLATGKAVYVDRSYTYSTIPAAYVGMHNLKTANDDKTASGSSFLSFNVNKAVTAYIAHDTSITGKPSWLGTWTDTGDELITSDSPLHLYSKDFPAGTITLGGNGGSGTDSMYVVLVSASGSGSATPFAVDDNATTPQNTAVMIDVLANDTGLADTPITVSILSTPDNGAAVVNPDNTITYTPTTGFAGTDTLNYRVTDADGDIATASATIQVTCSTCASGVILDVSWNANPAGENVLDYAVYFGASANTANQLVATAPSSATPSITLDAWNDLGLNLGDTACFRVKARNNAGYSGFSTAVCSTL